MDAFLLIASCFGCDVVGSRRAGNKKHVKMSCWSTGQVVQ